MASTDSLESCDGPEVASLLSDSFLLVSFSPNGNTNLVGKNDVVKKKKNSFSVFTARGGNATTAALSVAFGEFRPTLLWCLSLSKGRVAGVRVITASSNFIHAPA